MLKLSMTRRQQLEIGPEANPTIIAVELPEKVASVTLLLQFAAGSEFRIVNKPTERLARSERRR